MRSDTWARLPGSYHGSGCTLASAIAAMLANGLDMPEAVREAQDYTWHALKKALSSGHGPVSSGSAVLGAGGRRGARGRSPTRSGLRCPEPALTTRRRDGASGALRVAGLYAVTPDLADTADLVARVEAALDGGARAIQYRNKSAAAALKRSQAEALARVTAARGALSSSTTTPRSARPWTPMACTSARTTASIAAAREIVGPERIIGVSCYNDFARAEAAVAAGADYVAFGSFFPSRVKPDARRADVALLRGGARSACRSSRSAASRRTTRASLRAPERTRSP